MIDEYFDDQSLSFQQRQLKICSFLADQKSKYTTDKIKQTQELRRLKSKELTALKRGMSSGETVHKGSFQVACKKNDYFMRPMSLNQSYELQNKQASRLKSATTSSQKKNTSFVLNQQKQNSPSRPISSNWIPNQKNLKIFNEEAPIIEPDRQKYPAKQKTVKFVEQNIQNYVWNPTQQQPRPFSSTGYVNIDPKIPNIQENDKNILFSDQTDKQKVARQIYKGSLEGCIKFQKLKPFYPTNLVGQPFPVPKVVKANNKKYLKDDILTNDFYDTNRG